MSTLPLPEKPSPQTVTMTLPCPGCKIDVEWFGRFAPNGAGTTYSIYCSRCDAARRAA